MKKRNVVRVFNMGTRTEYFYSDISPQKAVFYAQQYAIGNHNTWDFDQMFESEKHKLVYGKSGMTVFFGEFSAKI
tara:strand:+ start:43 stop:267 length:225 start_codon:yes stop_codon:yes gene_type:complete